MEGILNFLANNYIWFLIAAVVLALALVGFIIDSKRKEKKRKMEDGSSEASVNEAPVTGVQNVEPTIEPNMVNTPVEPTVTPVEQTPSVEPVVTPIEPMQNMATPNVEPIVTEQAPSVEPVVTPVEPIQNMSTPVEPVSTPSIEPIVTPVEPTVTPINQTVSTPTVEPVTSVPNVEPVVTQAVGQNATPTNNIFDQPQPSTTFNDFSTPVENKPNVAPGANVNPQNVASRPVNQSVNNTETINFGDVQK